MKPSTLVIVALAASLPLFASAAAALAPNVHSVQADDLQAFGGRWLYVEDRTEGRPTEEQGPPMMVTFGLRIEEDAVVLERARGREERFPIDGSTIEIPGTGSTKRVRGAWEDGVLVYEQDSLRDSDDAVVGLIRREFRITGDGLLVRVIVGDPVQLDSYALYCHPEDIPLPTPAKATMDDVAWLAGAWTGTRGTSSIEERWSPPRGGAMLGVSRTVKGDRMVAFEYLRIVEREGKLVYVAQPGGGSATEFVLTGLDTERAVFDNPRHDSPQRIVYELSTEGVLTATIGFINGGRGTRFEFTHEGDF